MAKKKSPVPTYSPDGWFLNFLFLAVLIAGLFAATVLVQRRARYINQAAQMPAPTSEVEMQYPAEGFTDVEEMVVEEQDPQY